MYRINETKSILNPQERETIAINLNKNPLDPNAEKIINSYSGLINQKEVLGLGNKEIFSQIRKIGPFAHIPGYFITAVNMAEVYKIPEIRTKMTLAFQDDYAGNSGRSESYTLNKFNKFLDQNIRITSKTQKDILPSMIGIYFVADDVAHKFFDISTIQRLFDNYIELLNRGWIGPGVGTSLPGYVAGGAIIGGAMGLVLGMVGILGTGIAVVIGAAIGAIVGLIIDFLTEEEGEEDGEGEGEGEEGEGEEGIVDPCWNQNCDYQSLFGSHGLINDLQSQLPEISQTINITYLAFSNSFEMYKRVEIDKKLMDNKPIVIIK